MNAFETAPAPFPAPPISTHTNKGGVAFRTVGLDALDVKTVARPSIPDEYVPVIEGLRTLPAGSAIQVTRPGKMKLENLRNRLKSYVKRSEIAKQRPDVEFRFRATRDEESICIVCVLKGADEDAGG